MVFFWSPSQYGYELLNIYYLTLLNENWGNVIAPCSIQRHQIKNFNVSDKVISACMHEWALMVSINMFSDLFKWSGLYIYICMSGGRYVQIYITNTSFSIA